MAETETKTKHECKHGCGHTTDTKRKMFPHERFHCAMRPASAKDPARKSAKKCDCADGGEWAVLSTRETQWDLSPFMAQQNPDTGKPYAKYCRACGEVV